MNTDEFDFTGIVPKEPKIQQRNDAWDPHSFDTSRAPQQQPQLDRVDLVQVQQPLRVYPEKDLYVHRSRVLAFIDYSR